MANDCLVTKLKGTVNNNNLPYLGYIVMDMTLGPGRNDFINTHFLDGGLPPTGQLNLEIISDNDVYLTDETFQSYGKSHTYDTISHGSPIIAGNDIASGAKVKVSKYDISYIRETVENRFAFDLDELSYAVNLASLQIPSSFDNENILFDGLYLPALRYLNTQYSIPTLSNIATCFPNLTNLVIDVFPLTTGGTLADYADFPNIVYITTPLGGEILSWVSAMVSKGRRSATITLNTFNGLASFNGHVMPALISQFEFDQDNGYIIVKQEDKSNAWVYSEDATVRAAKIAELTNAGYATVTDVSNPPSE